MKTKKRFASYAAILIAAGMVLSSCASKPTESTAEYSAENTAETVSESPASAKTDISTDMADAPLFSISGGFYDEPVSLTLSAANDAAVYYTLDGSTPTTKSTQYTQPISISDRSPEPNTISMHTEIAPKTRYSEVSAPDAPVVKATAVRAIAVKPDGSQSSVASETYFIGFADKASYYKHLKTVSILTDEANLFDPARGIYVLGNVYDTWQNGDDYDPIMPEWKIPANYTQKGKEWEREASVQFFENGQPAVSQNVGIRIHGGATRSYPQKSLNLYARSQYGAPKLLYDAFSGNVTSQSTGEPIVEFDSLMLRNGGNDAMYTRFRDKLNQSLVADRQFLTQGMEPCIVFINGEYWGHYEITEKMDAAFIKAHYGVPKKNVCIIKKEALDSGAEESFAEWEQLRRWIQETDFSDPQAYDRLCSCVDMQGFMDYMSSEIYMNNANWGASNMAMWKAAVPDPENPYADGKWRFLMFDTEYSTGIYGEAKPTDDSFEKIMKSDCFLADLFNGALENAGFRQDFIRTFTEIAEKNFNAEHVSAEINALENAYHDMTIDTYNRFWNDSIGGAAAEGCYRNEVKTLRKFYEKRHDPIMKYLKQHIGSDTE